MEKVKAKRKLIDAYEFLARQSFGGTYCCEIFRDGFRHANLADELQRMPDAALDESRVIAFWIENGAGDIVCGNCNGISPRGWSCSFCPDCGAQMKNARRMR